ncbi:MAG: DNA mismatch repair protein MutS [Candidatus Woesearchaeota archaeon]
MEHLTPAMKQYMRIKKDNPDSLVLFRMGDFYETFYDDAVLAAKVLNITLTSRGKNEKKAPMAGIPYHALNTYLPKLLKNNIKVAIIEQVEDPKKAKGIVKRDLIRIITPGTIVEEDFLESDKNNYLLSIYENSIAYVDISTGDFYVTDNLNEDKLINELMKLKPSEIIIPSTEDKNKYEQLGFYVTLRPVHTFYYDNALETLKEHFNNVNIKNELINCSGALIEYIKETQKTNLSYINKINKFELKDYMTIDNSTQRNLELISNILDNSKDNTLFNILDKTVTSSGKRELKKFILRPLIDINKINERLDAVEILKDNYLLREELREVLKKLYDIERLISKISFGNANPKDLIALKLSLQNVPDIKLLLNEKKGLLNQLSDFPDISKITNLIENSIKDEPNISVREGNIIKENFNNELDELHKIKKDGTKFIKELESKEINRTNIKSLKIRYNKVFGYFIEVTKKNIHLVPEDYIRKQTQVNCERYITNELKEIEEKILSAEEKINELEYNLFIEITNKINEKTNEIQNIAKKISQIDVISSLADIAYNYNYCKPNLNNNYDIQIIKSRHPVIERKIENFVPNDCYLNQKNNMMIITGPNMAGKSTYMRQIALTVLMAHIGSYVPAEEANISLVDRIFTRVGAYDDLAHGQSTFMVEMNETANILNHATNKSLIILDEIGRGTSTFDGVSIAWSVAEYINKKIKAKTMFATHYHVLNSLEKTFSDISNYNIAVLEEHNKIVFLHKIVEGSTDKSYGIHVAELAGVPKEVIQRAKDIQMMLEGKDTMEKQINGNNKSKTNLKKTNNNLNKVKKDQKTLFEMAGKWV